MFDRHNPIGFDDEQQREENKERLEIDQWLREMFAAAQIVKEYMEGVAQAKIDGFDRFIEAMSGVATDHAMRVLSCPQIIAEFDAAEIITTAFLEGMFHYHQILMEENPEAACRMEALLDHIIAEMPDEDEDDGEG